MKRYIYFLFALVILMFWSSCRKDFSFSPSTGNLEFSRDTVYLDTVFSNIGSSTYNLKVYNRSDDDISIPIIQLRNGTNSLYRMNVDGMTGEVGSDEGKRFENVELLAKDSMFIFIETTIDIESLSSSDTQFLYTDAIQFDAGSNQQHVELVTLVKDAVFIYPQRDMNGVIETLSFDVDGDGNADDTEIQGRFLENSELTFTNEKPYVIYGYAAVDDGDELNIEAGARVHFHANSGLLVTSGGSLKVNGSLSTDPELLENEVIFEGDRLEPLFSDVPGQWGTIWLFNGSVDNEINYATIKNSSVGILCEGNQSAPNNKLQIRNSQIYNSSNFGILGRATSILGENLVINASGQSSFAGTVGGRYNFTHCTIANYWNNSFRQFPSVLLNNFIVDEDNTVIPNALSEANFNNCIIYGNDNPEFLLEEDNGADFNFKFTNCLLRFNNNNITGENYDFNNTDLYLDNFFNDDPDFRDPFANDLIIGEDSGANNNGNISFASLVMLDILGVDRTVNPDIGAYQSIVFEED
ncbi:hypothetical protein RM697_02885 [Ichthyenterobacterium sp. W332]|uniref:Right handed beta helix domain-containing protein n=1 Tax=Microcosmobacter mediterraneus TaxID=3075607 RepID=A0ABU2YKM8_9FLAO|nr:hypothetical protein [Ichthyenterobacterium sp. W332]MDT0557578.1 hypothetical protein [Ichthyenterobacterium sp. W332]